MWEKFIAKLAEWTNEIKAAIGDAKQMSADLATAKQTIASLQASAASGSGTATDSAKKIEELEKANADLTDRLSKATEQVNARDQQLSTIGTQLSGSLSTLKQTVDEKATIADKITALQGAVTNTLASFGIDPAQIPTSHGGTGATAAANSSVDALYKQYQGIADPTEKAVFWNKHKATLRSGFRPRGS